MKAGIDCQGKFSRVPFRFGGTVRARIGGTEIHMTLRIAVLLFMAACSAAELEFATRL